MGRLVHTGLGWSSLVAHVLKYPLRKQLCTRSSSNKHTHCNRYCSNKPHTHTLMVGIRSPDGLVVGLAPQLPWSFGFVSKREEPGKTGRHPGLKYRGPHGSQPRPGWAPDPLMVGIRSPDGLVVGSCSHPGVLGSFPNERNQEKQGATLCSSTGFLTGPTREHLYHRYAVIFTTLEHRTSCWTTRPLRSLSYSMIET